MYNIRTFNNISPVIHDYLDAQQFAVSDAGDNFHGVLVRSADLTQYDFPAETAGIARAGAGVNNIPIPACSERGIVVFNTPGANANAVRELVICSLLLCGRRIVEGIDWLKEQKAAGNSGLEKLAEKGKSQFVGHEIKGKKLGVLGLGAVGVQVVNAARCGMEMDVLGYDPYLSLNSAWQLPATAKRVNSLNEIYTQCDYMTLHLPLNDSTRNMIGADELAMMKDGVVILNFSRGGLIDNAAMLAALDSGKVYRYVTDFAADELVGHPGVICLPHLGASTPESEENCAAMAAAQMRDYLLNGNVVNSVNLPECTQARAAGTTRLTLFHRSAANIIAPLTAALDAAGLHAVDLLDKARGDWSYAIVDVDGDPSAVLPQLEAIDGVTRLRVLG